MPPNLDCVYSHEIQETKTRLFSNTAVLEFFMKAVEKNYEEVHFLDDISSI